VDKYVHGYRQVYAARGWTMFPGIDRVYDNARARRDLGWEPEYDFARVLGLIAAGKPGRSPLAAAVGAKGYHAQTFAGQPYPVE
jgi:UDP-glucose 4-epimerase